MKILYLVVLILFEQKCLLRSGFKKWMVRGGEGALVPSLFQNISKSIKDHFRALLLPLPPPPPPPPPTSPLPLDPYLGGGTWPARGAAVCVMKLPTKIAVAWGLIKYLTTRSSPSLTFSTASTAATCIHTSTADSSVATSFYLWSMLHRLGQVSGRRLYL